LTRVGLIGQLDEGAYRRDLDQLFTDATTWLDREGVPESDRTIEVALDLRYRGQAYEFPIRVKLPLEEAGWREAAAQFHDEHKRRYGYDQRSVPVEVVTLRVTATGILPKPALERRELGPADARGAMIDQVSVIFAEGTLETLVYERSALAPGATLTGPALIVQPDCTTVIHPGQTANVDAFGNLIVATGVTADMTLELDASVVS
jgi:N-methylhydantoinase A